MKAANKTILYSRVTIDKRVHNHPIAVFANEADAAAYAMLIMTAHKSGNAEMAKQLDSKTALAEDGTLIPGIKFSRVTVPYAPTLATSGDDLFADDSPAAS